jgi:hypothetical protein
MGRLSVAALGISAMLIRKPYASIIVLQSTTRPAVPQE